MTRTFGRFSAAGARPYGAAFLLSTARGRSLGDLLVLDAGDGRELAVRGREQRFLLTPCATLVQPFCSREMTRHEFSHVGQAIRAHAAATRAMALSYATPRDIANGLAESV